MENILKQSSVDQSFSSLYKNMKNQRKNTRGFVSKPVENMQGGSILLAPPLTSYSYHPSLALHNYQHHTQPQPQPPPLLPLPIHSSLPSRSRYPSCPPINRKSNRARDQSLVIKKKSNSKQPMKRENEILKPTDKIISESFIVTSVNPLGPDPNDLPKDISKVLSAGTIAVKNFEKFSGSVFVSPPPSSLPLPKFSLRPKLSCNAEASGVNAGATDNLRRLLRLR